MSSATARRGAMSPVASSGTSAYATAVLAESALLSYWRLNETSGTAAADSKGSNTGTYTGGFTLSGSGAVSGGRSTAFNGTTGYVNVPDNASLRLTGAYTMEAWVNPTSQIKEGILGKWAANSGYLFFLDNSAPLVNWTNSGGLYSSNGVLTTSAWNYVVATFDGTTAQLYLNASLLISNTTVAAPTSNTTPLNIGAYNNGANFFSGSIAEAAVYNAALSGAAISAHYAAR